MDQPRADTPSFPTAVNANGCERQLARPCFRPFFAPTAAGAGNGSINTAPTIRRPQIHASVWSGGSCMSKPTRHDKNLVKTTFQVFNPYLSNFSQIHIHIHITGNTVIDAPPQVRRKNLYPCVHA
ncbi:hypothetical protein [Polaromonas sp. CG_9.11]|uniref:hypothetical protein n=1 Tax=Polaromonas sp. CG_9.11 TaxID=2787730 RepID=UPI0018CB4D32